VRSAPRAQGRIREKPAATRQKTSAWEPGSAPQLECVAVPADVASESADTTALDPEPSGLWAPSALPRGGAEPDAGPSCRAVAGGATTLRNSLRRRADFPLHTARAEV
jgi:hypothetical protein